MSTHESLRSSAGTAKPERWSADPPTVEEVAAAIDRASREPDGDRVVVGHISRKLAISVGARLSRETGRTLDQVVRAASLR